MLGLSRCHSPVEIVSVSENVVMTPPWRSLLRLSLGCFCLEDSLPREVLPAIKDKLLSRLLEHFGARSICTHTEGNAQHTLGYATSLKPLDHIFETLLRTPHWRRPFEPWGFKCVCLSETAPTPYLSLLPVEGPLTLHIIIVPAIREDLENEPDLLLVDDGRHILELARNGCLIADDRYCIPI